MPARASRRVGISFQMHFFIPDRAPQPFDENVVHEAAASVHRNRDAGRRELAGESLTPFCLSSGDLGGVDFLAALSDEREDLSGEVALQGSNGVEFGMPFRDPTSDIVLGSLIGS